MMTYTDRAVRIPIQRSGEVLRSAAEAQSPEPLSAAEPPEGETPVRTGSRAPVAITEDGVDWQAKAMRLQAEMQTYRRRQQRWAEDEATREKTRLLQRFLEVVDNLEASLEHIDPHDPVHQGVQLAYDSMLALLLREGVERVVAQGRAFDPGLHEAVATVPVQAGGVADMHVAKVLTPGYRYAGQVLRPAKVVVARNTSR